MADPITATSILQIASPLTAHVTQPLMTEIYNTFQRVNSPRKFRKALMKNNPIKIHKLFNGCVNVNKKLKWTGEDGQQYTGSPLTIAICYQSFSVSKSTLACVEVEIFDDFNLHLLSCCTYLQALIKIGADVSEPGIWYNRICRPNVEI
jgi:hypothetical protein